jgi:hypothetical protein
MIDVKRAVKAAEEYARELYPETELRHLRLEEVELSDDERRWRVTLGWVEPAVSRNGLIFEPTLQVLPRVYKLFEVDAQTGQVASMKIREVA